MAPYWSPSCRATVSRFWPICTATAAMRFVESLQLLVDRVADDKMARNAKSLGADDERFADGYAGRNGDSL